MGILIVKLLHMGEVYIPQRLQGALTALFFGEGGVDAEGFLHLWANAHDGIHGGHRLLEHHRDVAALLLAHGLFIQRQQILPV